MADEKPTIHIDNDWKKQAQEEKRKLAETEARKKEQERATVASQPASSAASSAIPASAGPRGERELPPASLGTLVQSLTTQVLYYLGDLSPRGQQPMLNLDMAKHNIDLLTVLEEKTQNNLSADEKQLLDSALYETRMRYVSVAQQYIG